MAGYTGLPDTEALKKEYNSQEWQRCYQVYTSNKERLGKVKKQNTNPHSVFQKLGSWRESNLQENVATKDYGENDPTTTSWDIDDFVAHFIISIIKAKTNFQWGPFPQFGDEDYFEPWNRAYQLLNFLNDATRPSRLAAWRKPSTPRPAKLPPHMKPSQRSQSINASDELRPIDFKAIWMNRRDVQEEVGMEIELVDEEITRNS